MLNRWIEDELLDVLADEGVGCIAFSALAQGMLTDKYLGGVPDDSRAARAGSLRQEWLTDENLAQICHLNELAGGRGQSLAQMAIAWTLRDPGVTSALIGARTVEQLEENVAALDGPEFSDDEIAEIDRTVTDAGIDVWARSRRAG